MLHFYGGIASLVYWHKQLLQIILQFLLGRLVRRVTWISSSIILMVLGDRLQPHNYPFDKIDMSINNSNVSIEIRCCGIIHASWIMSINGQAEPIPGYGKHSKDFFFVFESTSLPGRFICRLKTLRLITCRSSTIWIRKPLVLYSREGLLPLASPKFWAYSTVWQPPSRLEPSS